MPRLIHALCFTRKDQKKILEEGPAVFKENIVNGNRIYVSYDVYPATREVHKKLLEKQKEYRKKGWYAFIPWKVPRVLKYRPGPKGSMTPVTISGVCHPRGCRTPVGYEVRDEGGLRPIDLLYFYQKL